MFSKWLDELENNPVMTIDFNIYPWTKNLYSNALEDEMNRFRSIVIQRKMKTTVIFKSKSPILLSASKNLMIVLVILGFNSNDIIKEIVFDGLRPSHTTLISILLDFNLISLKLGDGCACDEHFLTIMYYLNYGSHDLDSELMTVGDIDQNFLNALKLRMKTKKCKLEILDIGFFSFRGDFKHKDLYYKSLKAVFSTNPYLRELYLPDFLTKRSVKVKRLMKQNYSILKTNIDKPDHILNRNLKLYQSVQKLAITLILLRKRNSKLKLLDKQIVIMIAKSVFELRHDLEHLEHLVQINI